MYSHDGEANELLTIDPITGAGTVVAATGDFLFSAMAYDSSTDTLYGFDVESDRLVTIDRATGEISAFGSVFSIERGFFGMAYGSTRDRLVGIDGSEQLWEIDRVTGETIPLGELGSFFALAGNALTYDSVRDVFYAADTRLERLVLIDPITVTGSTGGRLREDLINVTGLEYEPSTDTLYGYEGARLRLLHIDIDTGLATPIGQVERDTASIASLAAAPLPQPIVPEPAGLALAALVVAVSVGHKRTPHRGGLKTLHGSM